jgi:hypothetical protein
MLFEYLVDDDKAPAEWFLLKPGDNDAGLETLCWDLQKPVEAMRPNLSVRADRMKPGAHVGGGLDPVYVSEGFREVVRAHRLRGIDFVWCKDIGKYRAPQWYYPVCDRCLGRGLGEFDVRPRDPGLQELLALVRKMELLRRPAHCRTFERYLRKYLPATDFAFTVRDVTYDGRYFRHRGLAINRRARDILRANRVIGDEYCAPVMILDRAPAGVDNLDRRLGPAEPTFSPEQMKQIRRLEAAALAEHAARPKPPRAPDLDRSLKLLRAHKRQTPGQFERPAAAAAIAKCGRDAGVSIPDAWQKVLRISNGGRVGDSPLASGYECRIIPVEKLARSRHAETSYFRSIGAELPGTLLPVVETETGDSVWLDTSRQRSNGDTGVILLSHETGGTEREWSSVAEFLEELLTASGENSSSE